MPRAARICLVILLFLASGALAARLDPQAGPRAAAASSLASTIAADRLWAGIVIVAEGAPRYTRAQLLQLRWTSVLGWAASGRPWSSGG